jgi:hypothetical protein
MMPAVLRQKPRRSKYRVRTDAAGKTARTVDGILFHSLKEAKRYRVLKLLEKAGKIRDLKTQYPFQLHCYNHLKQEFIVVGKYVADFIYWENGERTIEDCKGCWTAMARWKVRHFEAQYGVKVRIT